MIRTGTIGDLSKVCAVVARCHDADFSAAMRTISPFPSIHSVGGVPAGKSRRTLVPFRASEFPSPSTVESQGVPEGETMGATIARLPRAAALHADIVGLIHAVRGRFG